MTASPTNAVCHRERATVGPAIVGGIELRSSRGPWTRPFGPREAFIVALETKAAVPREQPLGDRPTLVHRLVTAPVARMKQRRHP